MRRRRKSHVFRRKSRLPRNLLTAAVLLGLVAAGYFGAQYVKNLPPKPAISSPDTGTTSVPDTTTTAPPTTTTNPPDTSSDTLSLDRVRAIYLPYTALRQPSAQENMLRQAVNAGYNGVVFDAKDQKGNIRYQSATPLAAQAKTISEDALTIEELKSAFEYLQTLGLTPIARIFAFQDHLGARNLSTARITISGLTWYDGPPSTTGRRWLNPYAPDAHRFILDLAKELQNIGCPLLMLEAVQFPFRTSKAEYGNHEWRSLSEGQVLTKFCDSLSETVGKDSWILSVPALAVVGEDTKPFGGNPLNFGSLAVSPILLPDDFGNTLKVGEEKVSNPKANLEQAVQLLMSQTKARVGLMDQQPVIIPWIAADSAAQISAQLSVLRQVSGKDTVILYHPDGQYTFS